jgi:hypothetical protein
MMSDKSIGLGEIAAGHSTDIECYLTWTTSMRPVVRKDDPPEEEDAG